jgi:hypothetical protein
MIILYHDYTINLFLFFYCISYNILSFLGITENVAKTGNHADSE